jgi:hypothetical protein
MRPLPSGTASSHELIGAESLRLSAALGSAAGDIWTDAIKAKKTLKASHPSHGLI